jgi:AAA15 family ATPase/GTPase
MLVNFSVKNFLSFDNEAILSLIPVPKIMQHKQHVVLNKKIHSVLKGCAIYGANASGKSNLIKALGLLANVIKEHGNINIFNARYNQFKFNKDDVTNFAIEYQVDGKLYNYSLSIDTEKVIEEELSYKVNKKDGYTTIFRRNKQKLYIPEQESREWYQYRTFPDNILFLSKLKDDGIIEQTKLSNREHFINTYSFIDSLMFVETKSKVSLPAFYSYFQKEEFRGFVRDLLKSADVGITDILLEDIPQNQSVSLFNELRPSPSLKAGKNGMLLSRRGDEFYFFFVNKNSLKAVKLKTKHGNVIFDTSQESSGTVKLLDLALGLYLYSKNGKCFVIDELDSSLHTCLVKNILNELLSTDNSSQIITTLHDVHLFTQEIWRVDEIWFTEKKYDNSTQLYSLADFSPRFDKTIGKDYLLGKYGAIPMLDGKNFFKKERGDDAKS